MRFWTIQGTKHNNQTLGPKILELIMDNGRIKCHTKVQFSFIKIFNFVLPSFYQALYNLIWKNHNVEKLL